MKVQEKIGDLIETSNNALVVRVREIMEDISNFILDGLSELFVPDEDYLSEKVAAIRERFAFADSIMETADSIKTAVYGSGKDGAPRITINLNAAESKYNYGGSALALDMSWYSRYKPAVDTVLSSILWVTFVWRVFVALPNIISGIGGSVVGYYESQDAIERKNRISVRRNRK